MHKSAFVALSTFALGLGACTWVETTPSGNAVRVAYDGNVAGCRDAGSISVSVKDKIAFYHRSDLTVRDELESLARNQAAGIPADTIRATSEPKNGEQQFAAYVCGAVRVQERTASAAPSVAPAPEEAQTHGIKDH